MLAQAMACGLPVIATEATGVRELVSDGVEGLVVRSGDSQALAQTIETLLAAVRSSVEPLVFFLSEHGLSESFDPEFGRAVKHDVPLLGEYDYRMVRNRSPKPAVGTSWGLFNSLCRLSFDIDEISRLLGMEFPGRER